MVHIYFTVTAVREDGTQHKDTFCGFGDVQAKSFIFYIFMTFYVKL